MCSLHPVVGAPTAAAVPVSQLHALVCFSQELFRDDSKTEFVVVTIPSMLAVAETERLVAQLREQVGAAEGVVVVAVFMLHPWRFFRCLPVGTTFVLATSRRRLPTVGASLQAQEFLYGGKETEKKKTCLFCESAVGLSHSLARHLSCGRW